MRPPAGNPAPPDGWGRGPGGGGGAPPPRPPSRFGKRKPPPPRWLRIVGKALWTVGGLGLMPYGPGTFGTVAGVAVALFAKNHPGHDQKILLAFACGLTLIGVPLASLAERVEGKDPPSFVWDEVVGYLVTMLGMPLREHQVLCIVGGFFAFRIFDILKPWPIRSIEAKPGGVAVMADDIVAGLYANVVIHVALMLLPLF